MLNQLGYANALEDELGNAIANRHLEVFGAEIEQNHANIAPVVYKFYSIKLLKFNKIMF